MKVKALQFIFVLLICFSFSNFNFAQTKVVALKFDEFSKSDEYLADSKMISERLKRFAVQLKKQPQMQALIIGYDSRKQFYNQYRIGDNQILTIQRQLESYGIDEKRVIRIVGGIRENESYELWLLPKDVETPKSHPEFEQSDLIYCLGYTSIEGVYYTLDRSKPLEFSTGTNLREIPREVNYEWEISAGKIVEGQGTAKIKVDVSKTTQNYLIVKLNFKGLALECKNQIITNVTFAKFPFKLAEFSGQGEDFKVYNDVLFTELFNNPNLEGKFFVYGSRNDRRKSAQFGIEKIQSAFKFRNYPLDKVPIEDGGYRENLTFEMWLYPKDSEPPQPTPTVDSKFINIPKQAKKAGRRK